VIGWLRRRLWCWFHGHSYRREGDTLGGVWIRCVICGALEEYLPGLHEPRGFDYP
jgi:hypothetical protein